MGFTIYLSSLPDDPPAKFERALVERAFAPIAAEMYGDGWSLRAPDGEWLAEVSLDDAPLIDGFRVNRPPSYDYLPGLYDALFEILRQTRTFLFWLAAEGGGPHYCVADADLIPPLVAQFGHYMGEPVLLASGADIEPAIEASFPGR